MQPIAAEEVPWDCFRFFIRTYSHNPRILRRVWESAPIDLVCCDVSRCLSYPKWRDLQEADKIRANFMKWLAMCERFGVRIGTAGLSVRVITGIHSH